MCKKFFEAICCHRVRLSKIGPLHKGDQLLKEAGMRSVRGTEEYKSTARKNVHACTREIKLCRSVKRLMNSNCKRNPNWSSASRSWDILFTAGSIDNEEKNKKSVQPWILNVKWMDHDQIRALVRVNVCSSIYLSTRCIQVILIHFFALVSHLALFQVFTCESIPRTKARFFFLNRLSLNHKQPDLVLSL